MSCLTVKNGCPLCLLSCLFVFVHTWCMYVCVCLHNHDLPPHRRHCEHCSSRWESHNDLCVQFLPCILWSTEGTCWPDLWPPLTNQASLPVQHGLRHHISAALDVLGHKHSLWKGSNESVDVICGALKLKKKTVKMLNYCLESSFRKGHFLTLSTLRKRRRRAHIKRWISSFSKFPGSFCPNLCK